MGVGEGRGAPPYHPMGVGAQRRANYRISYEEKFFLSPGTESAEMNFWPGETRRSPTKCPFLRTWSFLVLNAAKRYIGVPWWSLGQKIKVAQDTRGKRWTGPRARPGLFWLRPGQNKSPPRRGAACPTWVAANSGRLRRGDAVAAGSSPRETARWPAAAGRSRVSRR